MQGKFQYIVIVQRVFYVSLIPEHSLGQKRPKLRQILNLLVWRLFMIYDVIEYCDAFGKGDYMYI